MNVTKKLLLQSIGILLAVVAASASARAVDLDALAKKLGVATKDVRVSPIPGVYEVVSNNRIGYASEDGRYYLRGDMLDMEKRENITDKRTAELRKEALREIDESQMIIFRAPVQKYTVTVFTDVDCTYCRKFHSEIAKYNEAGITVRYMAFPRQGPKSDDWLKMEQVWCAKDRRAALTQAKLGDTVGKNCDKTPDIAPQWKLGVRLGMQGTPGVFTPDGRMVGGYIPVADLLAELDGSAARAAAASTKAEGAK